MTKRDILMVTHNKQRRTDVARHEFDGEKYQKASTHQKEWRIDLIQELKLTGNENVLDLGCGDGILTARIAEMVPEGKAVGIDSSRSMIETACRNVAPNIEFQTSVKTGHISNMSRK